MTGKSNIQWTEHTWNPIVGCSVLTPGCVNCYAMKMARRIEASYAGIPAGQGSRHYADTTKVINGNAVWTGKLALAGEATILQPLRRKKPTTYFVNSMGDLFHEDTPDAWIDRVFAVMALANQHKFQVLTKRAARMRSYVTAARERIYRTTVGGNENVGIMTSHTYHSRTQIGGTPPWPLPNVWLGVSAERQQEADDRIPDLLATPAAVRFISAEPLLGAIDLTRVGNIGAIRSALPDIVHREERGRPHSGDGSISGFQIEAVGRAGSSIEYFQTPDHMGGFTASSPRRVPRLDWVIVGGESGPDARPMHPTWARSLRDQCEDAGVPFFFKQWGMHAPLDKALPVIEASSNVAWPDGTIGGGRAEQRGGCGISLYRATKSVAGRKLDGVEYNGMPKVRP